MRTINDDWDAYAFFRSLIESNKLAQEKGFRCGRVSSLAGFEDYLAQMQTAAAMLLVQEVDAGEIRLDNTPHIRRVKTIYMCMRHKVDDMEARVRCFDTMRRLFGQLMSRTMQEKTELENNAMYMDSRISFNEISQDFAQGCACAYFVIAVDTYVDLSYKEEEWL